MLDLLTLLHLARDAGTGMLVGIVVGATGVGGGSLMTPILLVGYGLPLSLAVGTDLVFASITKSGAAWQYWRSGSIDWRVVRLLCLSSLPSSLLIIYLWPTHSLAFDQLASQLLGLALVLTSIAMLVRPWLTRRLRNRNKAGTGQPSAIALLLTGTAVGAAVALTSVGAGVIGTLALLICAPGLAITKIVGSEIAHAVVLTLVAGLGHAAIANVDWTLALALALGSFPGAILGARLAHGQLRHYLRHLLVVLVSLAGLRLVLG